MLLLLPTVTWPDQLLATVVNGATPYRYEKFYTKSRVYLPNGAITLASHQSRHQLLGAIDMDASKNGGFLQQTHGFSY